MKVAVVGGSGHVGSRLAHRLCLAGYEIVLASREPEDEKVKAVVATVQEGAPGKASAAECKAAVAGADAIIIATPGQATVEGWQKVLEPIVEYEGVVLDASNPLTAYPKLEISVDQNTTSAAEDIQKVLTKAKVYKAFNTVGMAVMTKVDFSRGPVTMMFAGPEDETTKALASEVIAAVGFKPEYVGGVRYARNLESIAELWIHLNLFSGWKIFAFDVLKE